MRTRKSGFPKKKAVRYQAEGDLDPKTIFRHLAEHYPQINLSGTNSVADIYRVLGAKMSVDNGGFYVQGDWKSRRDAMKCLESLPCVETNRITGGLFNGF